MEEGIIVPIAGIMLTIIITLGAFAMVIYIRKYENLERMAIIEKGLNPDIFRNAKKNANSSSTLRWSLLLIGVGIGFLMGMWLDRSFDMEETGYFSMLFIWGGLGLGLAYMIEEKRARNNN